MTLQIYPASSALQLTSGLGAPPGFLALGYKVKWTPVFFNQSAKTLTGASIDIALAQYPLHSFELTYPFLRDYDPQQLNVFNTEFRVLMGFWLQIGGSVGRFGFRNPDDYLVTGQTITNSYDGTTTSFTIVRTLGSSPLPVYGLTEPIGILDTPNFSTKVFFNGVQQTITTNYTLDTSVPGRQLLNLVTLPSAGTAITMNFGFLYYCKFVDDSLDFEKFANPIWSAPTVKIQSCRPGA
jgi:hypothetical protein